MRFAGARNFLNRIDEVVASRAKRHAGSFDREATEQHLRRLRKLEDVDYGKRTGGRVDPMSVEDYIATHAPRGKYPELRDTYLDPLNTDPAPAVAARLARGPLHGIATMTAENPDVRRAGLVALTAGTGVLLADSLGKTAEQINSMSTGEKALLAAASFGATLF